MEKQYYCAQNTMRSSYNRLGWGFVAFYGVMAGVSAVLTVIWVTVIGLFDSAKSGSFLTNLMDDYYEQMGPFLAIATAISMAVGAIIFRLVIKRGGMHAPEKKKLTGKEFFTYFFIAAGLWVVSAAISNMPSFVGIYDFLSGESIYEQMGDGYVWIAVYAVIGAPVVEEIICRKFVIDKVGFFDERTACIISGLIFGIMHGNATQFIYAFVLGVIFAIVYSRTGNIWYTILMHAMVNFAASVPEFFAVFGIDVSVAGNVLLALIMGVGIGVFVFNRKTGLLDFKESNVTFCRENSIKAGGIKFLTILFGILLAGETILYLLYMLLYSSVMNEIASLIIDFLGTSSFGSYSLPDGFFVLLIPPIVAMFMIWFTGVKILKNKAVPMYVDVRPATMAVPNQAQPQPEYQYPYMYYNRPVNPQLPEGMNGPQPQEGMPQYMAQSQYSQYQQNMFSPQEGIQWYPQGTQPQYIAQSQEGIQWYPQDVQPQEGAPQFAQQTAPSQESMPQFTQQTTPSQEGMPWPQQPIWSSEDQAFAETAAAEGNLEETAVTASGYEPAEVEAQDPGCKPVETEAPVPDCKPAEAEVPVPKQESAEVPAQSLQQEAENDGISVPEQKSEDEGFLYKQ